MDDTGKVKSCTKAMGLLSEKIGEEPLPSAFTLDPADVVLFY